VATYTPNYNLYLPSEGETYWDDKLNNNFTIIDSTLHSLQVQINSHELRTDNPHQVTYEQVGAAPASHTHNDKADKVPGTTAGNLASLDATGNLQDSGYSASDFATVATYSGTLSAVGWSGTAAPYSQTVSITGITADDEPIIDVVMSGNYATDSIRNEEWGYIYRAVTGTNSITFYAIEKPTVDLPFTAKVVK
jgi:hypothetical protein